LDEIEKNGKNLPKNGRNLRIRTAISLKPHIMEQLEWYAAKKGIPKSNVVALAIEKLVQEEKAREK